MDIVYHYCSNETFLSIMQNKKLWLSSIEHMNDFMEKKWFLNIFHEEISKRATDSAYQKMLDDIITNQFHSKQFMCCLSKSGDILSQWRAYAEDGRGVCLGFNPAAFNVNRNHQVTTNIYVKNSLTLNDVQYSSKEQIELLLNLMFKRNHDVIDFYRGPDSDFMEVSPKLQNKIVAFSRFIDHNSLHIKNPAFAEEQEIRLCYNYFPPYHHEKNELNEPYYDFINSYKFRISNGHLASHFEFEFKPECIKEVILGPKNKISTDDLKRFLDANNFSHKIDIKKSSASYR
ncbi:DUF2971 domain-containing protein [Pseudescherichia vulneris]|uniref:DUF2971 domain-containing protein n=1 Tax=Pseudescherichia vulneris TaxID=566 RepID=UPI0028A785A3|nr:DUF2971 domain-containing protein [Pseudescherichia vulneris]